jgi:CFEM domain
MSCYVLILALASIGASQNPTFSIRSVNEYQLLRQCAQSCLWDDYLQDDLSCPDPPLNACMCRTDLGPSASSYLTQCVNSECASNSNDVFSAVSLYDSYCVANGYIPATTTPLGSLPSSVGSFTQPTVVSPTKSGSTSSTTVPASSELLLIFTLALAILPALVHRLS